MTRNCCRRNGRKKQRNVVPRPGQWPFLPCVVIMQSDYVDPISSTEYAKTWRSIFLGTSQYGSCLYGIVERYVIAERGKKTTRVAWVHRDDPRDKLAVFNSNPKYPIKLSDP